MRHARAIGFAGFVALVAGAVAFAQSTVEPLPESPPVEVAPLDSSALAALADTQAGDPARGASLAAPCAACHGLDGNPPDGLPYPASPGRANAMSPSSWPCSRAASATAAGRGNDPFAPAVAAGHARPGRVLRHQGRRRRLADDSPGRGRPLRRDEVLRDRRAALPRRRRQPRDPACLACHGRRRRQPGPAYPAVAGRKQPRRTPPAGYRQGTTSLQDRRCSTSWPDRRAAERPGIQALVPATCRACTSAPTPPRWRRWSGGDGPGRRRRPEPAAGPRPTPQGTDPPGRPGPAPCCPACPAAVPAGAGALPAARSAGGGVDYVRIPAASAGASRARSRWSRSSPTLRPLRPVPADARPMDAARRADVRVYHVPAAYQPDNAYARATSLEAWAGRELHPRVFDASTASHAAGHNASRGKSWRSSPARAWTGAVAAPMDAPATDER